MKGMKLNVKVGFGFGTVLTVVALIVIGVLIAAGSVERKTNRTKEECRERVELAMIAQQMKLDAVQVQQWLTDISATRAQAGLDDGYDEAGKSANSFFEGARKFEAKFTKEKNFDGLKNIAALKASFAEYYKTGKAMSKAYIEEGTEAGNRTMLAFDGAAKQLEEDMNPFIAVQVAGLDAATKGIVSSMSFLRLGIMIAGMIAILAGMIISVSITMGVNAIIKGLLGETSKLVEAVAGGRLDERANVEKTNFEFRPIVMGVNTILDTMNEALLQVVDSVTQVTAASEQINSSAQIVAEGASEQASSLEEITSSLDEMSSMTKMNAANASQAQSLAKEAYESAARGNKEMERMSNAIEDIKNASDQTAKIVKTIDEIAFQTNLLALNAAVEAARAGEAGKGFAVVAEEVRNLAMRSAEAAKNTSVMIEGSVKNANNGVKIVSEVAAILKEISAGTENVNNLVKEIALASKEQSQGIDQVNMAVLQLEKVTQSNSTNAEESAGASEELSNQAMSLSGMVGEFTLSGQSGGSTVRAAQHLSTARYRQIPARTAMTNGVRQTKKITTAAAGKAENMPSAMIPFDEDEDFKEF